MTRRVFLRRSLLLSAVCVVPTVACRGYEREMPEGTTLAVLEPWEFVVLRAATARILDGADPPVDAAAVVRRIDGELAALGDPGVRAGLGQALALLEYGTLLAVKAGRFSTLAPADQDEVLAALAESRFTAARATFTVVKSLACFYHYTEPATWPALGYRGPWIGRVPLPAYVVEYGERNGVPFVSGTRPYPPRTV